MRREHEQYAAVRPWVVWDDGDIGTEPEAEGGRSVHVANTHHLDARYIVNEHNTRLMQIETKNEVILALRQDKQQLREENRNLRGRVNELSWALNPEEHS